jgi:tRNA(Arg) A34 adenosine deaminase TadA
MNSPVIEITLPEWVKTFVEWDKTYTTDEERMTLAVNLSIENIRRATGGPFGAAIFDGVTGRVVSVGLNQVVRLNNSALHAEVTAIMAAQKNLETYNLNFDGAGRYELFTSCEPCCMCLGAVLWSGAKRLVCGATKQDASGIGFDEGPVYESSYEYLETRGIEIKRNCLRGEAVKAFRLYEQSDGVIYNS